MELITSRMCMTKDIGVHNNLFGGKMMSWLDEAGAVLAARVADTTNIVTLKIEEVLFKKPVKSGQLIMIFGEVVEIGNTSITLQLEAKSHNVENGLQKTVCSTKMIFVKIDDQGEPSPLTDKVKTKYSNKLRK